MGHGLTSDAVWSVGSERSPFEASNRYWLDAVVTVHRRAASQSIATMPGRAARVTTGSKAVELATESVGAVGP